MFRFYVLPLLVATSALFAEDEVTSDTPISENLVADVPEYLAKASAEEAAKGREIPIRDGKEIKYVTIPEGEPMFTGPLLCPSGHTAPAGHMNVEPYVFVNDTLGYYNNHWKIHKFSKPEKNINFQLPIQSGISDRWDCSFSPQFFHTYNGNKKTTAFGDLPIATAYQIYLSQPGSILPSMKIEFTEVFPTGKYDQLDADLLGTDLSGGGSFGSNITLAGTDLWYLGGHHFLSMRTASTVSFFSNVKVDGLNAYGGDSSTSGTVKPGFALSSITGLELSVTKHWALALDLGITYTAKTKFEGTTTAPVGNDNHSVILSVAPALEYNYSQNLGIIGGAWLSTLGYNAPKFVNGVVAINWYYP